jgi:hypothetical protein
VLLSLVVAVIAFAVYLAITVGRRPEPNRTSFCLPDGPDHMMVVLIDRTDAINPVQRQSLQNHLDALVEQLPRYAGLEVFGVYAFGDLLQPIAALVCNPGRAKDASQWTENPTLIERRWSRGFIAPTKAAIGKALHSEDAQVSPLFEAIQSIAVTAFQPARAARTKRLIIVSDMLHNTTQLSQYGSSVSFDEFRRTPYYRKVRAELNGIEVQIFYLRRDTPAQGRQHIEFWQDYFNDMGARLTRVVSIEG